MNEITQAINDLHVAGMIPAGLLTIVGLLLWAAGRRVMKAGLAAVGLIVGAVAGWMLTIAIGVAVEAWIGAIVLGLAFAAFAAIVTRMVTTFVVALVLATAAPMTVMALRDMDPPTPSEEVSETTVGSDSTTVIGATVDLPEEAEETLRDAGESVDQLINAVRAHWDGMPEDARPIVLGAAVAGFLAGMLLGAAVPSIGTIVVTAFGGSLLWLASAQFLLASISAEAATAADPGAKAKLGIWCAVAVIGVIIQWRWRPKAADDPG